MEIRTSHLRYLLTIYELSQERMDVGTADIAKAIDCSKASVTHMMSNLMEMGLLVRERQNLSDRHRLSFGKGYVPGGHRTARTNSRHGPQFDRRGNVGAGP